LEGCVKEACAVGITEGAKVALEPILAALEGLLDGFRNSMQKGVAAGRSPELDAIAGPVLHGGSEHGIDVSATRALVDRVLLSLVSPPTQPPRVPHRAFAASPRKGNLHALPTARELAAIRRQVMSTETGWDDLGTWVTPCDLNTEGG